jgi:hypothetical protein
MEAWLSRVQRHWGQPRGQIFGQPVGGKPGPTPKIRPVEVLSMPNPQESGSQHNQGISKEKEGAGQEQQ